MKISTQNQSRFLSHDDVRTPILATMDGVTEDRTLRNPYVLHFTDPRLKPFPLNVTNRRILVAAYGDDDAGWRGQLVELYFNPSIPNPRTPAQPGGICVRIPTGNGTRHTAVPESPPPAVPRPAPSTRPGAVANGAAPAPKATPQPLAAEKTRALEGFRRADTTENLDRWRRWADSLPFDDETRAELSRAYVAAQGRIALAPAPTRRPAPARA